MKMQIIQCLPRSFAKRLATYKLQVRVTVHH